jgi:DNA-binding GntR family transcriptional regulator
MPVRPERPVRKSIGTDAADYISHLIFSGELRPGERVPQERIAEVLGMSKVPVREALVALERDGWVTLEQYRGAFVNPITEDAIREHYELGKAVFSFLLRRAMARQSTVLGAAVIEVCQLIAETQDADEMGKLVREFNLLLIADMSDNHRARIVLRTIVNSGFMTGNQFAAIPAFVELSRRYFPRISAAIEASDPETAITAAHEMMDANAHHLIRHYIDHGVIDASIDLRRRR